MFRISVSELIVIVSNLSAQVPPRMVNRGPSGVQVGPGALRDFSKAAIRKTVWSAFQLGSSGDSITGHYVGAQDLVEVATKVDYYP